VAVVIPCYNYGHFLPTCVGSVTDQPDVEVDVMIVDDASPDGSVEVAHRLAAADRRVRVLAQPVNQGHIATYNRGLAEVDSDHVLLLSADDLLAPGALARAAALFDEFPEVGLVHGFAPTFRSDPPPPARTVTRSWSVWGGPEWLDIVCRRGSNPIYTAEAIMRTSTMRELKGYDPELPHAADFLLWLRAAAIGSVGRVNGVDQAYYRIHGANMHVQQFGGALRDLTERHRAFEIVLTEYGQQLDVVRLRRTADAAVAREALVMACQWYESPEGRPPDDDGDLNIAGQLAAFAERISPDVPSTPYYRAYLGHVARARSGRTSRPGPLRTLGARGVASLRWRRWRRTGVLSAVRSI
jgi:glycosyltransferase involved in cell wall biosynthesis